MIADFAPRLARVLTEYCRPVQKGDLVMITSTTEAEPLILALYEAVLKRGGNPVVRLQLPGLTELYMTHATEEQFDFLDPSLMTLVNAADVYLYVDAPTNTKAMATFDAERLARLQQGRRPYIERYLERCADDDLRWNITAWPTQAAAQDAEMGLLAYSEFMVHAFGLDRDDPVAYWTAFRDRQARLVDWLAGKEHAEVRGPGIDLAFNFAGRTWINSHGVRNFPDGEIFTSPVEDSVNGSVAFNLPSVYGGRELGGVRLELKDGVVVEASAAKDEAYLLSQLHIDAGARRLGEFAIGTNEGIDRFTRSILFDEKMGGTIHMALGESIAVAGGVNKSAIHWDMVHAMRDGGEILIDGELFYQNGAFVVG
ncbi:MAG: aminopeptidase [Anaerolineae bacterium]|nr:aminopeptidase [Anaerolineae bacterium]